MLSKNILTQRDQLEMVAIDQLVPQNHLVRKMEAALDLSFIYDEVPDRQRDDPSLTIYTPTDEGRILPKK